MMRKAQIMSYPQLPGQVLMGRGIGRIERQWVIGDERCVLWGQQVSTKTVLIEHDLVLTVAPTR